MDQLHRFVVIVIVIEIEFEILIYLEEDFRVGLLDCIDLELLLNLEREVFA